VAELGHARQRRGSLATVPAFALLRLRAFLLGPGWGPATWFALVVAGLGGVAPVGFLGEPGQGLAAGALNGVVATGILAPVWAAPLVATIVCTEPELGIDGHRWVTGIRPTSLRRRRRIEAVLGTGAVLALGALVGVLGAVVANAVTPGEWSSGLTGWTGAAGTLLAVASVVVSTLLSVAVGELCGRRRLAVVLLEGSVLATAALLSILYFVPSLRPVQVMSPWIGVWPLRAEQQHSPLLASSIDERLAAVVTAVWVVALFIATSRREPDRVPGA
jgi:hypothetical protein